MSDDQLGPADEEDTNGEVTPATDWDALVEDHAARIAGIVGARTCLCGSTRFLSTFITLNAALTKWGVSVHSIAVRLGKSVKDANLELGQVGDVLDRVHRQKISASTSVLVLDVGGYVGEGTQQEVAFAESKRMPIHYLSKICVWRDPELEWALGYAFNIRIAGSRAVLEG